MNIVFTMILLAASPSALAANITKNHTFTAGGTASASQVNENFDQLFGEMNAKETRVAALEGGGTISLWTVGAGLTYYTGNVGVGASPAYRLDVRGGEMRLLYENGYSLFYNDVYSNTAAEAPYIVTRRGRGSLAVPAFAQNGDRLGGISFRGHSLAAGTQISSYATQNHSGAGIGANLRFYTVANNATGSTERMRIEPNGNVIIGTATPESLLDVRGMLSAGNATTGINNPNAVAVLRSFTNPHLILEKSGVNVGGFAADSGNMVIASEMADITFRTNVDYNGDFTSTGNERMRINNDGDVGIGTDDPHAKLHIVPTETGGRGLILDKYDNAEGGELLINGNTKSWNIDNAWGSLRFSRFGANLGGFESITMTLDTSNNVSINAAGALQFGGSNVCTSAGCMVAPSDRRLKENIRPLEDSLARIAKLKGVSYDWIDRQKYREGARIGFIAQELEETFPEVVVTDKKTGMKSVSYGHLVAPLVEAVKSLYASLTGTQNDVAKLKAENAALKERAEKNERELASLKERLDRLEKR